MRTDGINPGGAFVRRRRNRFACRNAVGLGLLVIFGLVSCRSRQLLNVEPPFRECVVDASAREVHLRTLFNAAPTVVALPSGRVRNVTGINASSRNDTGAAFQLDFKTCPGFVLIYAKRREQSGTVYLDFGDDSRLVLRLTEISALTRTGGEKVLPDRTVIIDPAGSPLLAQWHLNEQIVRRLPVSCGSRAVTLMFPSGQIQEVSGINITADPGRERGDFLVKWKRDDYYVQIRSLRQRATGSLNVVYENRRYVFSLHDVPRRTPPRFPDTITFTGP